MIDICLCHRTRQYPRIGPNCWRRVDRHHLFLEDVFVTRPSETLTLQLSHDHYAEAADYWRRYLASDCQSEWASRVRRALGRHIQPYCMREEFVPHCSESCWRAAAGTMGGGPTYVGRATEGTGCLPAKLERAINCMPLIAGRTKFAHSLKLPAS
jgi:hypothetical protein